VQRVVHADLTAAGVAAQLAAGGGHLLTFLFAHRDRDGGEPQRLHEGVDAA
jgi:hypothetical protein